MSKPHFLDSKLLNSRPQPSEEPHIQREIDSDKTGTIRRYLRLADNLLKPDDEDPSSGAA